MVCASSLGGFAAEIGGSALQGLNLHLAAELDDPDRVFFAHIVVQILRKQDALLAILAFDKALHRVPPKRFPTSRF